ncbi:MAG: hypothetical protein WC517_02140 [Patescibacteria group bacterium]
MVNEAQRNRERGFRELGIPHEAVIALEAKKIPVPDPIEIITSTENLNKLLAAEGFSFRVTSLGFFECLQLDLEYRIKQRTAIKHGEKPSPNRSLISIAAVLEAERVIRLRHKLVTNPASGKERQEFEKESQTLLDKMIKDCQEYRLRKQAVERLKAQGKAVPLTEEVNAMVETIRAETTQDQARVASANQVPST